MIRWFLVTENRDCYSQRAGREKARQPSDKKTEKAKGEMGRYSHEDSQDETSLFETGDDSAVVPTGETGINRGSGDVNTRAVSARQNADLQTPPNLVQRSTVDLNIPRTPLKEKYEFLSVIGAGGAGVIYKAKQQPLGRLVAVKMIHSHLMTPTAVKRFQQEATTIAKIAHPNIISVYDFGISEDNQPFMVMDYVEGTPLSSVLDDVGRLSADDTKLITKQLCDGLAHAHSKGILHRDLKPSNIMMVPVEHGQDVAKILDFGLAKTIFGDEDEDEREHLTKTGETVGTPAFMSPEQVMGKALDQTSDLYSLGCVMYHCLTGEPPFVGETKMETMLMHLNAKPEPINPSEGEPLVSPYLEMIVLKLLEKNPADRFQSMIEVKEAINATERGLFSTPPKVAKPVNVASDTNRGKAAGAQLPTEQISTSSIDSPSFLGHILTARALLVVLILIGLLSIPLMIGYIWINAYPSKDEAARPVKKKQNKTMKKGDDPYEAHKFDDDAFKGHFDPRAQTLSAHHDPFISDNGLSVAEGNRNIRNVELSEAHSITEKGIKYFQGCNVQRMILSKTQVGDGVGDWLLKMIGPDGLPSLIELNLSETLVTDKIIPSLRLLTRLEILDLSSNKGITGAGAKQLGKPGLKTLNLANTAVTDDGLVGLAKATDLIKLDLSGTEVSDSGVKNLTGMNSLQEINLSNTKVSDAGVNALVKLKNLSLLNLSKTNITHECLNTIFKRDQISWIDITGCANITPVQANEFRHKMSMEGRSVIRHEASVQ